MLQIAVINMRFDRGKVGSYKFEYNDATGDVAQAYHASTNIRSTNRALNYPNIYEAIAAVVALERPKWYAVTID